MDVWQLFTTGLSGSGNTGCASFFKVTHTHPYLPGQKPGLHCVASTCISDCSQGVPHCCLGDNEVPGAESPTADTFRSNTLHPPFRKEALGRRGAPALTGGRRAVLTRAAPASSRLRRHPCSLPTGDTERKPRGLLVSNFAHKKNKTRSCSAS